MQWKHIGAMLDELRAVLQDQGCQVIEMSVTFHPVEDDAPSILAAKADVEAKRHGVGAVEPHHGCIGLSPARE